ncbi:unnamed protein product, partial [marine sediment metagenome]
DNQWNQVVIPFFGDEIKFPVTFTNELFSPEPEKITALDFIIPFNRPYSFAIDKLEGIRAPAGNVPIPDVLPIQDVSERIQSGIEELEKYEKTAREVQGIMWQQEKAMEANKKAVGAQEILNNYIEKWEQTYKDQKNTFSYQRGLYVLKKVQWINRIDIDRLEVWQDYPDGTIVGFSPFVPEQYREYPVLLSDVTYMSDGLRITGVIAKPKGEGPFPLVVVNHGGGSHAKDHLIQIMRIASAGFVVFAPDYRGHGDSEGDYGSHFARIPIYGRDSINGLKMA